MAQDPELQSQVSLPYFASEVLYDLENLKLGERQSRGKDYFYPITYKDKPLQIQTPCMLVLWELKPYRNPGSYLSKFSIYLSLSETELAMADLNSLIDGIDKEMSEKVHHMPNDFYIKSSKVNRIKPLHENFLRVKVPNIENTLLIDIETSDKIIEEPTVEEFKSLIKHRTKVYCILELGGLWFANHKYGVSYQLVKIQLVEASRKKVKFRAAN